MYLYWYEIIIQSNVLIFYQKLFIDFYFDVELLATLYNSRDDGMKNTCIFFNNIITNLSNFSCELIRTHIFLITTLIEMWNFSVAVNDLLFKIEAHQFIVQVRYFYLTWWLSFPFLRSMHANSLQSHKFENHSFFLIRCVSPVPLFVSIL